SVEGVKGRAEVVPTDTDYTVMIDYAHSPDGLENILKTVKEIAEKRVIAVFGCGGDRDAAKRPKMGKIAAEYADVVIVTSDNPRTEDPDAIIDDIIPGVEEVTKEYERIPDRREAIFHALSIARKGDIVVLAGKGHETYQEIDHIKHHMDEREIVNEYFGR
ncbi:MAG: UDP-N-acetylmuramoyl-L-alanyl-D-glutamate--2,6-diaminopimelate ligase, partial [Oscillospiraceae bacterium]|nr:UDP-N-acetylmuramoyl-L-alanyl-D-glutamate--2,6-diaminopimelate ligase [Oscillospiraceae bacterium]